MERQSYRTHTGASSPAFDGGDVIAVSLMDCASQQMFGETTMIELDINNRVGSTLSSDKRPAILTVVPRPNPRENCSASSKVGCTLDN